MIPLKEASKVYLHCFIGNEEIQDSPIEVEIVKSDKHLQIEQDQLAREKAAKEARLAKLREEEALRKKKI